jgi:outer membrane protein
MICTCGILSIFPRISPAKSLPLVRIGVVYDGPHSDLGLGKFFRQGMIQKEILSLTQGEFNVQFPKKFQIHGGWSAKKVNRALTALLKQADVDMILTLGILGTNAALQRKSFPKPVIAPFVIDAELQGVPLPTGKSRIPNLTYLRSFKSFERDLEAFLEIVAFKHLALVQDAAIPDAIPQVLEKINRAAQANDIVIHNIQVTDTIEPLWKQLPPEIDAVFVVPLFRLPGKEFDNMVQGFIDRGLPSFSLTGRSEVERGIFAGLAPETDSIRIARRIALNVHRILLGEPAEALPVTFSEGEQLTINMATARAINIWPSFRILTEATLLNEESKGIARKLSLYSVVREAAHVNLDLAAADRQVAAGIGAVQNARSALLPQISIGSSANLIDEDRAKTSFGNNPEKAAFAQGSFEQLLYSDKAWTNYTVEQRNQDSRKADRRQVELDVTQEAALAYLQVLRTKTIESIKKENLKLTRSNLELARIREHVGAAARDEVYRWESEIANGRIDVLNAQAQRQQAAVSLNRTLYRPLEELFETTEAGLEDPILFHDVERIFVYVNNPRNFQIFRDFQVREGLRLAPELHGLQARIAAQQRILLNAQRGFWTPDLKLKSDVSQRMAEAGSGQSAPTGALSQDRTTWNLQLGLSFPLFSGGAKDATQTQALETLRQLQLEQKATVGRIEERIRTTNIDAGASSATIRLSREASHAAQKNLELVRDQYSRGAVDIIKLLDSQNAALTANLNAANAVYEFLIDIINIHRAAGSFPFFDSSEELESWHRRLEAYFQEQGINTNMEIVRSPFK